MRVVFLIFLLSKPFLALGASIEGDTVFNLLFRGDQNSQQNQIDEKPKHDGEMRLIFADNDNKAVPLNSYLQTGDDGTPILGNEAPFILNPVRPRAILFIQPINEAQEQGNGLSNNGEVGIVANSDENVAKPAEIVPNSNENDVKSVEIAEKPSESFVKPMEGVAKPDGAIVNSNENVAIPDGDDKVTLKEFLSKLFGSEDDPKTSDNDALKAPAEQMEQVKLPDYDFLLANKPFYDALMIEKGLLTRVNKLETIIDNGLSEPHLNADKSGYALEEEMYKKDFILGIMNIKTEILKFLNWRTAKRLRNLYAGIKLGDYEYKPMPTADFYKEIQHLLKMVRLADIIVEMERVNSLEDTNSKISNLIPVNPHNDETPVVESPNIIPNDVERDNNVPKEENIKPIDEIYDKDQQNAVNMVENGNNNVPNDENETYGEINNENLENANKIVEIDEKTDKDASNDNVMLAPSLNDDRDEKKDEPVEDVDHPEYSTEEHIFPYWMLWIMERKFKLQNIHHKNKRSRRWTFLQYGSILDSKNDEDAILNTDNIAAILNTNKMGIILDSNKLKFFPSSNKVSDKHYSKMTNAVFNSILNSKQMDTIWNSDEEAILNLKRKRAIWSLKKIGRILDLNRVGDNRRTKINAGGYRITNNRGNFLNYKKLTTIVNSDKEAILNLKRKRAIWSLKKIGKILNSNRIGDRWSKIMSDDRKHNNMGNFISYNKLTTILNSDEEAILNLKRKRAIWSLKKIRQILNSNRVGDRQSKIITENRKSNNVGSYKKLVTALKRNKLINNYLNIDSLLDSSPAELLEQVANNVKPAKRGFSMLTRLKLFSLLSDGYVPPRRIFLPKEPVIFLKNNQVISAETRTMLRPAGAPLRWG